MSPLTNSYFFFVCDCAFFWAGVCASCRRWTDSTESAGSLLLLSEVVGRSAAGVGVESLFIA